MEMSMEIGILIAYAFGIFVLYVVGYLFLVPIKVLLRLLLNSILGGIFLLVFNLIGEFWQMHIPLNPISAIIVGILGLPGVILLLLI